MFEKRKFNIDGLLDDYTKTPHNFINFNSKYSSNLKSPVIKNLKNDYITLNEKTKKRIIVEFL